MDSEIKQSRQQKITTVMLGRVLINMPRGLRSRKLTWERTSFCAAKSHKPTPGWLFDHLVGATQHRCRYSDAQRFGDFEIDGKFEARWLFDGHFGRVGTLEDFVNIVRRAAIAEARIRFGWS